MTRQQQQQTVSAEVDSSCRMEAKYYNSTWDIADNILPAVDNVVEFVEYPVGYVKYVYSGSCVEAKTHQCGWAARNANNHNQVILKKSCLGVLLCDKQCRINSGLDIVRVRPSICDKARRKQIDKPCPTTGCPGRLYLQPCRGHSGYPVTHFWREVCQSTSSVIFFQAKGDHDHPPPVQKSLSTRRNRNKLKENKKPVGSLNQSTAATNKLTVKQHNQRQQQQKRRRRQQQQQQQQLLNDKSLTVSRDVITSTTDTDDVTLRCDFWTTQQHLTTTATTTHVPSLPVCLPPTTTVSVVPRVEQQQVTNNNNNNNNHLTKPVYWNAAKVLQSPVAHTELCFSQFEHATYCDRDMTYKRANNYFSAPQSTTYHQQQHQIPSPDSTTTFTNAHFLDSAYFPPTVQHQTTADYPYMYSNFTNYFSCGAPALARHQCDVTGCDVISGPVNWNSSHCNWSELTLQQRLASSSGQSADSQRTLDLNMSAPVCHVTTAQNTQRPTYCSLY